LRSVLLLLLMLTLMTLMMVLLLSLLLLLLLVLLPLQSDVAPESSSCTAAAEVQIVTQACASQVRLSTLRP
jgi:hypothetical protein